MLLAALQKKEPIYQEINGRCFFFFFFLRILRFLEVLSGILLRINI